MFVALEGRLLSEEEVRFVSRFHHKLIECLDDPQRRTQYVDVGPFEPPPAAQRE